MDSNARIAVIACAALTVAALFPSRSAMAQSPRVIHLDYAVSAECPDQDAFVLQLRNRIPRVSFARDENALQLSVAVRRLHRRFEGQIAIREGRGSLSQRAVRGDTCAEVLAALAVIAALAADPTGGAMPSGAAQAPEQNSRGEVSATTPHEPTPPTPPPVLGEAPMAERPAPSASREGSVWNGAAGAQGAASGRLQGTAPVSVVAFVAIARASREQISPELRLRFERTLDATTHAASGGGRFVWTLGAIDACAMQNVLAPARIGACLRVEGGALSATGIDVAPSRSDVRAWLAVDLVARGRVEIIGPWFVELEVGAIFPMLRDRFLLEPSTTIFRPAIATWFGGGGFGVTFW